MRLLALLAVAVLSLLTSSPSFAQDKNASGSRILVMIARPADRNAEDGYGSGRAPDRRARAVASRNGLQLVDSWAMPLIGVDCFVMATPVGLGAQAALQRVGHDPDVAWAEPVALYSTRASPMHNDPLYAAEPAAQQWHLADLHRIANGRGSRIAVIDSGIDGKHPDLTGQLAMNRNFVSGQSLVPEQHGTAVAGIIAAKADNRIGIAGVAPGARLLGLRACWQQSATSTQCDTLSLAKALYFAIQNRADIINLSLAGPDARLLRELLGIAYARGASIVSAFDPHLPRGGFPASVPGVIAVSDAAIGGSHGELYVAPGRDVPTTLPGGRWSLVNGSSFAAAHVSGLIALIRQGHLASPVQLIAAKGAIDACATLLRVTDKCDCQCGASGSVRAGGH